MVGSTTRYFALRDRTTLPPMLMLPAFITLDAVLYYMLSQHFFIIVYRDRMVTGDTTRLAHSPRPSTAMTTDYWRDYEG